MTNEELLKELQKLGYNDFIVPAGEYEVAAEVGDEGGAVKLAKDGRLIKKAKNLKSMPEIINKVKQYVEEGGSGLKTNNKAFLNSAELSEEKFVQELVSKYLPILTKAVNNYEVDKPHYGLVGFWPTILIEFEKFKRAKNIQAIRGVIMYCEERMLKKQTEYLHTVSQFQRDYRAELNKKYSKAKYDQQEANALNKEYSKMIAATDKYNRGLFDITYLFKEMKKEMDEFEKKNGANK